MDKYKELKNIGKGSFGKCILVENLATHEKSLVKKIPIANLSKKEKMEALNEVKVLSSLKNPHIIRYDESFIESGQLCIIMEFAEKGDLYQLIQNKKNVLSEDEILDLFVQLCSAVAYCHSRKILHRDLKTQNVFIGKDGKVKLGDFGIARVLASTRELAQTLVGTPYYLSPEICKEKPYNNKSDIWSLGCILYEMCIGKHPFEGNSMKELVGKIVRGVFTPLPLKYSKNLRELLNILLQVEPKNRPSMSKILELPFLQKYAKNIPGIEQYVTPSVVAPPPAESEQKKLTPVPGPVLPSCVEIPKKEDNKNPKISPKQQVLQLKPDPIPKPAPKPAMLPKEPMLQRDGAVPVPKIVQNLKENEDNVKKYLQLKMKEKQILEQKKAEIEKEGKAFLEKKKKEEDNIQEKMKKLAIMEAARRRLKGKELALQARGRPPIQNLGDKEKERLEKMEKDKIDRMEQEKDIEKKKIEEISKQAQLVARLYSKKKEEGVGLAKVERPDFQEKQNQIQIEPQKHFQQQKFSDFPVFSVEQQHVESEAEKRKRLLAEMKQEKPTRFMYIEKQQQQQPQQQPQPVQNKGRSSEEEQRRKDFFENKAAAAKNKQRIKEELGLVAPPSEKGPNSARSEEGPRNSENSPVVPLKKKHSISENENNGSGSSSSSDSAESAMYRVEKTKKILEQKMGTQKFIELYNAFGKEDLTETKRESNSLYDLLYHLKTTEEKIQSGQNQ